MRQRKKTVAFFEVFEEERAALKRYLPKSLPVVFYSQTVQSSAVKEPPSEIVSIRTQSRLPAPWTRTVKGLLTRSCGYDHVAFRREAMACGYLPNYCADAVAEQAVLLAVALLRRLPKQTSSFSTFNRDGLTGMEAAGKKLLVLGVGRIGKKVIRLAKSLRMDVRGTDIAPTTSQVKYVALRSGWPWADVVICCLPLTERTNALLNFELFKNNRRGIILVNVGRGEITPFADLSRGLRCGYLSGLGMDVYEDEATLADSLREGKNSGDARLVRALQKRRDVIFTPHNAFNTREALERKVQESVKAIEYFLQHRRFPNSVPVDS